MPFENFPYADYHNLNVDWLLKKVKELEAHMSPQDVDAAVYRLLDEWRRTGKLREALLIPYKDACSGWIGTTRGFAVSKAGPVVQMSHTMTLTIDSVTQQSGVDFWYTGTYTIPVDMPITRASVLVSTDEHIWSAYEVNYDDTDVSFILGTPIDYTADLPMTVTARVFVSARIPTPPEHPLYGVVAGPYGNEGAVTVAKSYYNARQSGRLFKYGLNWTYDSTDLVNDADGFGMMECDTLVLMALLGVDYNSSPYATLTPDYHFDFNNLVLDPDNIYPWVSGTSELAKPVGGVWTNGFGGRITTAGALAWWFTKNGMVFSSKADVQSGDVALFRKLPDPKPDADLRGNFGNVQHVGILEKDSDGQVWVYHVTTWEWTGGQIIVKDKLEDFYNRVPGRYRPEDTLFARIDYSQT